MSSNLLSRRRQALTISVDILEAAKDEVGKTQILYSVGLSYEQLVRYLGYLKNEGFIMKSGNLYRTTPKGLRLIEEFESSPLTRSILSR